MPGTTPAARRAAPTVAGRSPQQVGERTPFGEVRGAQQLLQALVEGSVDAVPTREQDDLAVEVVDLAGGASREALPGRAPAGLVALDRLDGEVDAVAVQLPVERERDAGGPQHGDALVVQPPLGLGPQVVGSGEQVQAV